MRSITHLAPCLPEALGSSAKFLVQLSSWDPSLAQISSTWVEEAYPVEFRIVSRALKTRK